ncbi:MAG: NAD+ synthase [archaeon]
MIGRDFDSQEVCARLVESTKAFFSDAGFQKAVIGLSGGIDSSVCAAILVQALGKENVTGLIMPHSGVSDKRHTDDANNLADTLGIKTQTILIDPFIGSFGALPWDGSKLADMNACSRLRAVILYHHANTHHELVCGTSNRTEMLLGYFTKYGDGAVDFELLGGLYKGEVYGLGRHLDIAAAILETPPTADLHPGQTDEEEIGASYEVIDAVLRQRYDDGKDEESIAAAVGEPDVVRRILALAETNAHKCELPRTISSGLKR